MAESADASDLKSGEGNLVWVQVPLAPPSFLYLDVKEIPKK